MTRAGRRILHLFANYKWTGPADPAIRLAARLRSLGEDVTFAQAGFVHRGGEHRMAEQLRDWALPVVSGLELRKHFHVRSLLRDVGALRELIARDRYRILHCHLPADHLLAAVACRRVADPPRIVRSLYDPDPPSRGWRERYAFGRTAAVIAPTRSARNGVLARFSLPEDRVALLDPATERRRLEGPDRRTAWKLAPDALVVGITARIQPHRRFDLLWDVASRVVAAEPRARFVLLGRGNDEDTRRLVLEPIARLGLKDRVVLPGYQRGADYDAALRTLDAFLFLVPGSDGTCRAVADAMAFGVPVVAADRGILPSLLAPRSSGEAPGMVCAERAEDLAKALIALLSDPGRREAIGSVALSIARREMNPARQARAVRDLYDRIA